MDITNNQVNAQNAAKIVQFAGILLFVKGVTWVAYLIQMNELGAYFAIKNCQIALNALYKKVSLNAQNAWMGISYMHLFVMIVVSN